MTRFPCVIAVLVRQAAVAAVFFAAASPLWAMDGEGTVFDHLTIASVLGTSGLSMSTSHPDRVFESARDDALAYVASEGEIHGAQFEQALHAFRHEYPQSGFSDMQVALVIASQR